MTSAHACVLEMFFTKIEFMSYLLVINILNDCRILSTIHLYINSLNLIVFNEVCYILAQMVVSHDFISG